MVSHIIHHASLVHPSTHSPALLDLIHLKLSPPVIDYVVDCVVDTVDYAMGRPSTSRGHFTAKRSQLSSFTTFVNNIISRAEISTPVVLASLVYVDRAKPHLHIALEEWALERVFLGAIMTASKYLNDSTLKNVHWALCTSVFGKRDVGRIEREFLDVLDFELRIAEDDILSHHNYLSALLSTQSPRFSHPQPHHHSTVHHQDVPTLEPSSSPESSSLDSSSPRTPSPLTPPPLVPSRKSSFPHASKAPPPARKSLHMSTLDLLRSFPLPIPHPSHSKASARSHPNAVAQGGNSASHVSCPVMPRQLYA